jgi:Xylose isomerase-like TIM barrel
VVRCFLGGVAERLGPPTIDQHVEECIRVLRAVVPYAEAQGVKIAVENHGGVDLLARELRDLVEAVGSDSVGVCLDTGNPTYAAEDPLVSCEVLAPYTLRGRHVITDAFRAARCAGGSSSSSPREMHLDGDGRRRARRRTPYARLGIDGYPAHF